MKAAILLILSLLSFTAFAQSSTSLLSPVKLHQINNGNTCCYSNEFLASIKQPEYFETKKLLPKLDIDNTTDGDIRAQWALFWTWQVLDVYTTLLALEYDCIEEVNPLLPRRPNAADIILLKSALLLPMAYQQRNTRIPPDEFHSINYIMTYVIVNNIDQYNTAKSQCP
jgi:hypothetical protein